MKNNIDIAGGCFVAIIIAILEPIIFFGCGWFNGYILRFFIGDAVVNALNILFNTTKFTPECLPIVCGGLAVIGSFFKNINTSNYSKK